MKSSSAQTQSSISHTVGLPHDRPVLNLKLRCTLYYKVLLPTIAIFQAQKNCITTCNTKHATSIAIPVAILKSIAILIAIIAILQYYQPWLLVTSASDLLVRTIRFCSVVFGVTSSLAVIRTIYCDVHRARAHLVALALKNHRDGDFIARGTWWSNSRSIRPAI